MEKDIGPETKLSIVGEDGAMKMSIDFVGTDLSAGAFIKTTPQQLCDALAKLIPGDTSAEAIALGIVKGALDLAIKAV